MGDGDQANRCDSCGANLPPLAAVCEHCGRRASIMVKGVRFIALLERLIEIERFDEVDSLAFDILKEEPQSGVAWAAKGLAAARLKGATTDSMLQSVLKCFEYARQFSNKDGMLKSFREKAGVALCTRAAERLRCAVEWGSGLLNVSDLHGAIQAKKAFGQAFAQAFLEAHRLCLAADQVWPEGRRQIDTVLQAVDDLGEQSLGLLYVEGDYQRTRRPPKAEEPETAARPAKGFWASLFGA
jgi:hypothetical protein